jgi:hypothetical protein
MGMKKLIIFGIGEQAELVYFKNETNCQIKAFTVKIKSLLLKRLLLG